MEGQQLDEIQWRMPSFVQQLNGINSNTVHHYFSASPFFDPASNNGVVLSQASRNYSMSHLLQSRVAFEDRLRTMAGEEFMITGEPSAPSAPAVGDAQGQVWIMRKQRRHRASPDSEITILGTYFIVGENIYQAPSVGDVLKNRMLAVATAFTSFVSLAAQQPLFSPAQGYTYPAPAAKPSTSLIGDASQRASRATTPLPEASQPPSSQQGPKAGTESEGDVTQDTSLLVESFRLALRYGNEYMDENPLKGEPGNFTFTQSAAHLEAQRQREKDEGEKKAQREKEKADQLSQQRPIKSGASPTPSPRMGLVALKDAGRKSSLGLGGAGGKEKRRKSKPNVQVPVGSAS